MLITQKEAEEGKIKEQKYNALKGKVSATISRVHLKTLEKFDIHDMHIVYQYYNLRLGTLSEEFI